MRRAARLPLAVFGVVLLLLGGVGLVPPSDFTRFRWSWGAAAVVVAGIVTLVIAVRGAGRRVG